MIDECAYYCVCYQLFVAPLTISPVDDIMAELLNRNVELRFMPSLVQLADAVSNSTLNFSIIRMRNAVK